MWVPVCEPIEIVDRLELSPRSISRVRPIWIDGSLGQCTIPLRTGEDMSIQPELDEAVRSLFRLASEREAVPWSSDSMIYLLRDAEVTASRVVEGQP
jgi:hypothetical protein